MGTEGQGERAEQSWLGSSSNNEGGEGQLMLQGLCLKSPASLGTVTVPGLTEFKHHSNNALKHRVGLLRCPVQGQQLDSMMLVGSLSITRDILGFYDQPLPDATSCSVLSWWLPAAPGQRCPLECCASPSAHLDRKWGSSAPQL